MADEKRNIELNFQTNVSSTIDQLRDLQSTLDDNSAEYQALQVQIEETERALKEYDATLNSNIATERQVLQAKEKLQKQYASNEKTIQKSTAATKENTTATKGLTEEVTSNGAAMSILDSITGGYASRVKDAYEASNIFRKSTEGKTIAMRAYTAVVGTSTGALRAFKLALAATGIGLAVVAVGALVANWDKLTDSIGGSNKALDDHRAKVRDIIKDGERYKEEIQFQQKILLDLVRDESKAYNIRARALIQLQELSNISNVLSEENAQKLVTQKELSRVLNQIVDFSSEALSTEVELNAYIKERRDLIVQIDELIEKRDNIGLQKQPVFSFSSLHTYEEIYTKEIDGLLKEKERLDALITESTQVILFNKVVSDLGYGSIDFPTEDAIDYTEAIRALIETNRELNELHYINTSDNLAVKLLREEEVAIERLLDLKQAQLKENRLLLHQSKETYEEANQITNDYYNNEIKKSEERIKVLKDNEEEFNSILLNNSKLLRNATYEDLRQIEYDVDSFISTISDPEIQQAYLQVFNVDGVRALSSFIKQFQSDLQKYTADLASYNEQVFDPLLIEKEKEAIETIKDSNVTKLQLALENSLKLLEIDEEEAIKRAEILRASEEELANIRKFYSDKRTEETENTNNLIVEEESKRAAAEKRIDDIAFEQKMMIASAEAGLLHSAAQLMSDHTAGHKTLAIASATIDTYASAVSSYRGMTEAIPGPVGIAAGIAAAGSSILMGLNNVKQILAVKVPGGSGSAGGGGSNSFNQPNVDFVSSSENQIANTVGDRMQSNTEPIKAYVVTSDVSSAMTLERNKIESNSL